MYCRVAAFNGTFDNYGLLYFVPDQEIEHVHPGKIIDIPLKNSIEIGVVLELLPDISEQGIDRDKIKSIIGVKDTRVFLSPYQLYLVDFISQNYITPIHNALGIFFPKNLREKIEKQTLHKVIPKEYSYQYKNINKLSPPQQEAYDSIQKSKNNNILLYGVTGSGKTEIYRELIQKNISQGKQTLLLIPEIILGNQIGERIRDIFGQEVLVISSTVTEAKKTQYWIDIESKNAQIIIGTRSALFYPYRNLGSIIIDEEHDQSYVSDSAPRYSTIDIAKEVTHQLNIPLILASGTPSIQSMYRALKGEMKLINLLKKYKGT